MCNNGLPACIDMYVTGAHGGQKGRLDSLEPELQVVISQTWSSARAVSEPSLHPHENEFFTKFTTL